MLEDLAGKKVHVMPLQILRRRGLLYSLSKPAREKKPRHLKARHLIGPQKLISGRLLRIYFLLPDRCQPADYGHGYIKPELFGGIMVGQAGVLIDPGIAFGPELRRKYPPFQAVFLRSDDRARQAGDQ